MAVLGVFCVWWEGAGCPQKCWLNRSAADGSPHLRILCDQRSCYAFHGSCMIFDTHVLVGGTSRGLLTLSSWCMVQALCSCDLHGSSMPFLADDYEDKGKRQFVCKSYGRRTRGQGRSVQSDSLLRLAARSGERFAGACLSLRGTQISAAPIGRATRQLFAAALFGALCRGYVRLLHARQVSSHGQTHSI